MKKLLILVLILLSTVSISLIIAKQVFNKERGIASSTSVDTNGNIQFIDDQKLVSFYYPPGAKSVQSKSPTPIGGLSFFASYNNQEVDGSWTIMFVGSPLEKNALSQSDELLKIKGSLLKTYTKIEDITLGGEPAILYYYNDSTGKTIETIHNGMDYSIGFGGGNKSENDDEAIENAYNTVVRTLIFIK